MLLTLNINHDMYQVSLLKSPTSEEIEQMVDVLHIAFSRQYFISAVGDEKLSRELIKSHFTDALAAENGEIYVARAESNGEIVGAAVWFGPGCVFLGTEKQRAAGWNDLYAKFTKSQQEWWDYFITYYDEYGARAFGPGVKLAGYHLQVIGVHPDHRRHGIAREFFQIVEEKAKEQGVCTCLETVGTGALPAYKGLGYDVKEPGALRRPSDPNATAPLYGIIKTFN